MKNTWTRDEQENIEQALARSGQLQLQFLAILNAGNYSQQPHIAAHAVAELLGQVLRAIVLLDPNQQEWAVTMAANVSDYVQQAAAGPVAVPGQRTH